MVNAFPAAQLSTVDLSTLPQNNIIINGGGIGISCPNGVIMHDIILAASSSNIALGFPSVIATALIICILPITATDLIVKVGSSSPVSLTLPVGMSQFFYSMTSAQISLSSVLGGQVQYAIGG